MYLKEKNHVLVELIEQKSQRRINKLYFLLPKYHEFEAFGMVDKSFVHWLKIENKWNNQKNNQCGQFIPSETLPRRSEYVNTASHSVWINSKL